MLLMMKMMMMRWESWHHKTEWQGHCVLRNCSSVLSIYSSPHISDGNHVGDGGYWWSSWCIWWARLGLTPPSQISPRVPKFLIQLFCDWEDQKAIFSVLSDILIISLFSSNCTQWPDSLLSSPFSSAQGGLKINRKYFYNDSVSGNLIKLSDTLKSQKRLVEKSAYRRLCYSLFPFPQLRMV
jgi:hypothetical protein